jgi:DNA-binding MarR family transcriptional regulator
VPQPEDNSLPSEPISEDSPGTAEGDHVDRVRAQWRAVRPEIDTSPIDIVARIGRAAAYFDQSTNALMSEHGLARSSWDVLASLRRAGPPYELSPTELYRGLMRTSGAMTNRLNRLELAGLIERVPDPDDGRGLLVRLTAEGRDLVDEIAPLHMENERRLLESLTEEELEALQASLRQLLRRFEQTSASPPREGPQAKS